MHSPPMVSIVVATRNRPDLLPITLKSIRSQTLADVQVIVVDDGSDKQTLDAYPAIWESVDLQERLQVVGGVAPDLPGTGPAAARNRGIGHAKGKYIAFCDDDDHWCATDHLAVAVQAMEASGADMFVANMRGESHGKVTIPDWFPDSPSLTVGPIVHNDPPVHAVTLRNFMKAMRHHYAHPNGLVVRRELFEQVGGFWDRLRHAEDINLILRLADQSKGVLFRPSPTVAFNVSPIAKSYNSASRVEHQLIQALAGDHAAAVTRHAVTQACASAIASWANRNIAKELAKQNRHRSAFRFAYRAVQTKCTLGTVLFALRTAGQALVGSALCPKGGSEPGPTRMKDPFPNK